MTLTCPKCGAGMRQYERNGVTVDQCSECRGLFLDRGELEHLLDAEKAWSSAPPAPMPQQQPQQPMYDYRGHRYPKRKKSFLSELFDD
jgi:uncharacterized protein